MFDLIKHLVKNDIHHTVSDNGNITVGGSLYLSGTGITTLPDNLSVGGHIYPPVDAGVRAKDDQ